MIEKEGKILVPSCQKEEKHNFSPLSLWSDSGKLWREWERNETNFASRCHHVTAVAHVWAESGAFVQTCIRLMEVIKGRVSAANIACPSYLDEPIHSEQAGELCPAVRLDETPRILSTLHILFMSPTCPPHVACILPVLPYVDIITGGPCFSMACPLRGGAALALCWQSSCSVGKNTCFLSFFVRLGVYFAFFKFSLFLQLVCTLEINLASISSLQLYVL